MTSANWLSELLLRSSSNGFFDHRPIAEERISLIILSPNTSNSLELNYGTRILRVIPIKGLSRPWALLDGPIAVFEIDGIPRPQRKHFSYKTDFSSRTNKPPEGLVRSFVGYRDAELTKWDNSIDENRISWFPHSCFHEALTLNALLRSREAHLGGVEMIEHLDNLNFFINRFYRLQDTDDDEMKKKVGEGWNMSESLIK